MVECEFLSGNQSVNCSGIIYDEEERQLTYLDPWFWAFFGVYVALVLLAGLMSGLTMGLLSLDLMSLKVLQEGGTPSQQRQARKIFPVVSRHHLLLVTLLLANAIAVESMPLFLDRISDPITAVAVSVSAVLLFGEVLPQALCTRYGLGIGSFLVPLVYVLMGLLFVVAWPISRLLDFLLGEGHTTFYRRAELKALVTLHGQTDASQTDGAGRGGSGPDDEPDGEEKLTMDEVLIIKGALDMKHKTVGCAMVPIESAFMMDVTATLDGPTMDKLLSAAHSRVPLYEQTRANVRGVLLVKTLIKLSPDAATRCSQLLDQPAYCRPPAFVREDRPLFDMLNEFQTGKSHMALVTRARSGDAVIEHETLVGLITLEDVLEELLQEEIVDETDVYVDVHRRVRVAKAQVARQALVQGAETRGLRTDANNANLDDDENEPLLLA